MLKKYNQSLELSLRPGFKTVLLLSSLHLTAFFSCVVSAVSPEIKLALSVLIGFSYWKNLAEHWLAPVEKIGYSAATGWRIRKKWKVFETISILDSTLLAPWMIVFRYFDQDLRIQSILIFDEIEYTIDYRKLKVILKITASS